MQNASNWADDPTCVYHMDPDTPIIDITITRDDIIGIVEEINDPNITFDLAMARVATWARHIEEIASTIVNEGLDNVIRKDVP